MLVCRAVLAKFLKPAQTLAYPPSSHGLLSRGPRVGVAVAYWLPQPSRGGQLVELISAQAKVANRC